MSASITGTFEQERWAKFAQLVADLEARKPMPPEMETKWQIIRSLGESAVQKIMAEKLNSSRKELRELGKIVGKGHSGNMMVLAMVWYVFPEILDLDKPGGTPVQ